jgi:hypothetical protein
MKIQELIKQKDDGVKAAVEAFEKTKARLMAEILQAEQERDQMIEHLRAERDDAMLKEKLKEYPAKLISEHINCSICGGLMRPFKFMENEKVVKAWACQYGGLSETHDLIRV